MVTTPDAIEPQPTRAQRVISGVARPVKDERTRSVVLLAAIGAVVALAPIPFGPLGVAALIVVAADGKRR